MSMPNYKTQIKAVFFDIDETLYMKDTDTLPASVLPALQKLKQAGVVIGIASGRVEASFPAKIHHLIQEVGIDTLVTSNGQFVKCQDKVLRNATMPPTLVQPLLDFLREHHIAYATINNHKLAVSALTPKLCGALDPITHNYQVDPHYAKHHGILQILSFSDVSQDDLLANSGLLKGLKTIRWHENSLDILESEGSKARGIKKVADYLGISMENIMAFGDGLNDVEMLTEVGIGVAMGNAHAELKPYANHITKRVEEDGIADFLKRANLI